MGQLLGRRRDSEGTNDHLELELPVRNPFARPNNHVKTARYTLVNFLFKSGLEQFRNLSNVYFLVIVILAVLGTYTNLFESPYSFAGTLLGLVLVMGFTMTFEGYYDIKRHREDKEVNNRTAYRLRPGDGHLEEVTWAELRPGDVIKVYDRSQFPADLLFVTSNVRSKCYVETANIDGETNLKIKRVHKDMVDRCMLPDQVASLQAHIKYDLPSAFLTFTGSMRLFDDRYVREPSPDGYVDVPLDATNVLLRGCVLRNTPWILGIVLYAGIETTAVQSSRDPPTKMSRIQKLINKIIVSILIVGLVMCTASSLIQIFGYASESSLYYLAQDSDNAFALPLFLSNFCTFVVLYSSLLPISLLFCMTFSNFWQAMFVAWDLEMYHKETNTPAKCNTMELVQELGQVSYLFSDKTGTLTRNEMKLVGCSVQGETFGVGADQSGVTTDCSLREIFAELVQRMRSTEETQLKNSLRDFLMLLAVCHTVLVDSSSGSVQYNAEGPDEEALVSAAADIGFRLVATEGGSYTLEIDFSDESYEHWIKRADKEDDEEENEDEEDRNGAAAESKGPMPPSEPDSDREYKVEILATNQFNSTRKRMSVVCRFPDGQLVLLVKGADTMMFEIARPPSNEEQEASRKLLTEHLDLFANDGLRTLVMAKKELTQAEYAVWQSQYDAASNALGEQRSIKLEEAAHAIEKDVEIVGASAIEDRLQEGVPETLVALREAGVKTWVLTGDKVETAINISFSARLFTPEMQLVRITSEDAYENLKTLKELHALMCPQHLAADSEKRRKGREVRAKAKTGEKSHSKERRRSYTLGNAVHQMEKGVGMASKSVMKIGRATASLVSFRSPTEEDIELDRFAQEFSSKEGSFSKARAAKGQQQQQQLHDGDIVTGEKSGGDVSPVAESTQVSACSAGDTDLEAGLDPEPASSEKRSSGLFRVAHKLSQMGFGPSTSSEGHEDERDAANSNNNSVKRKRRSSKSRLLRKMGSSWRVAEPLLPEGVHKSEKNINERELLGTEKNLDGFEAENMALIVSGHALRGLLAIQDGDEETQALLLAIARLCSVVVACRVSPKQKALIVRMVKMGVKMDDGSSPITLAIGDGANDVAMIQEARVGVGISGHEGRQAVNSSDFAIAQFRFLQQLMLVHGRWNYRRAATMVLFVFYANILFVITAFVYNFYNKFSGSALYFVFLTTVYAYPSQMPICVIASINKDISRKTALEYPAMYISGRRNLHLNRASAYEYIFKAFMHGFLICAICIIWGAPNDVNIATVGTAVYMACVWVCVSRSCLETYTWTWINFGVVLFGYTSMMAFEPIYYSSDPSVYVRFGRTVIFGDYGQPEWLWQVVFLATVMCMVYDMFFMYLRKEFSPTVVDVVIEIDRQYGEGRDKKHRLRTVNKVFRKIAQPLTIPATAISELLASANISNVSGARDRSAFDFDSPDEMVMSMVGSLLSSQWHKQPRQIGQEAHAPGAAVQPPAAPKKVSLAQLNQTSIGVLHANQELEMAEMGTATIRPTVASSFQLTGNDASIKSIV